MANEQRPETCVCGLSTEPAHSHDDRGILYGRQAEQVPVTTYVDAYYWTCKECGWLGTGHTSESSALGEAALHFDHMHGGRANTSIERKDVR